MPALLALATLDDSTKIEIILFESLHPRKPRQVGWHDYGAKSWLTITDIFANVNEPVLEKYFDCHMTIVRSDICTINAF
jgi:hypothetical protein